MIKITINYKNYKLKFNFLCILILIIIIINTCFITNQKEKKIENMFKNWFKSKDYKNNKFIIIQHNCNTCGLFSFYKVSIGCILKYLLKGYIPIIDLKTYPNIINGNDTNKNS